MAWTFPDNYQTMQSLTASSDQRANAIIINTTYGGTNYYNSAAFDYFSDSAAAEEYILFRFGRRFWGLKFNVGTAIAATSITLVWEYYDGSAWQPLKVTNPNAFLSTGEQYVTWTPPRDWECGTYMYDVRCRIDSVTGLTEGGANSTSVVQINLKALTCTGTESTLSAAVTADLAGTYTILPASTPAPSLLTPLPPLPITLLKQRAIVTPGMTDLRLLTRFTV